MTTPRFRLSLALSADGFIADANGGVDWLHDFSPDELGFDGFLREVESIVVGRTTYDQVLGFGSWPYAGKRVVVMTHRPFTPGTPDTEVWTGDVGTLADRLAVETRSGDVWVMGGGAVARAFLASGRLDALELAYIPILLGEGIPLFGPGTPRVRLKLLTTEQFKSGIVRVDYAVER